MNKTKLQEARKILEEAEKLITVSWTLWYPDWINATPLFEKCGSIFRQLKEWELAQLAFEKAAIGQESQNSKWQAARHLETAGNMAAELQNVGTAKALFLKAVDLYSESGMASSQVLSEALSRIARILEESDPEDSVQLYLRACAVLEDAGESNGGDCFRSTADLLISLNRFQEAADTYLRLGKVSILLGATNVAPKAFLSAIIVLLFDGSIHSAQTCLNRCIEEDCFVESPCCETSESILRFWRTKNLEGLSSAIKSSVVSNLDTSIVRLTVQLPQKLLSSDAHELKSGTELASILNGDEEDDDDLT